MMMMMTSSLKDLGLYLRLQTAAETESTVSNVRRLSSITTQGGREIFGGVTMVV